MSEQQTQCECGGRRLRRSDPAGPLQGEPYCERGLSCQMGKGEPTPPATPQQPVGLVCPFCRDDDFDAVGLKLHLTTYCEAYASVEVGNRVY